MITLSIHMGHPITFEDLLKKREHFVCGDVVYVFVDRIRRLVVAIDLANDTVTRLDLHNKFPPRQIDLNLVLFA